MIKLKDLKNRIYSEKVCVGFEIIILKDNLPNAEYRFRKKQEGDSPTWNLNIIIQRTRDADSQVYNFEYQIPRENIPLETIAAIGLKFYQLYLKEEIQSKMNLDFDLGEMLVGM